MTWNLYCTSSCRPGCNRRFSVVSNLRRHFKVHGRKAAATAASNASTCLRPLACSPPISSLMQHQQQEKQSSSSSSSSASIVKSSPSLSVNNSFESWSLIDPQPLDTTHLQLQHSYTGMQTPISTSAPIPAVTSVLLDHEFMPSTPAFFNLPIMDHDPAAIGTSTTSPQTHSLYPVLDSWLSMPLLANLAQSSTATLGWFEWYMAHAPPHPHIFIHIQNYHFIKTRFFYIIPIQYSMQIIHQSSWSSFAYHQHYIHTCWYSRQLFPPSNNRPCMTFITCYHFGVPCLIYMLLIQVYLTTFQNYISEGQPCGL